MPSDCALNNGWSWLKKDRTYGSVGVNNQEDERYPKPTKRREKPLFRFELAYWAWKIDHYAQNKKYEWSFW